MNNIAAKASASATASATQSALAKEEDNLRERGGEQGAGLCCAEWDGIG